MVKIPFFFSPGAAAPDPAPRATIVKNRKKCPREVSFLAYIFHFAKNHDTMLVCKYTFSHNFHVTHKYASMFLEIYMELVYWGGYLNRVQEGRCFAVTAPAAGEFVLENAIGA